MDRDIEKPGNEKFAAFIADILEVFEKHEMSLGHQDYQGAFLIEPLTEQHIEWLKNCLIEEPYCS